MNKIRKRKMYLWLVAIIFLGLAGYKWVTYKLRKTELLHNTAYTTGEIRYFSYDGRGTAGWFYFSYVVDGKIYENSEHDRGVGNTKNGPDAFVGKSFPVVYNRLNPKNSHLIITPSDFTEYRIEFPDSLNWVLEYINHK